MNINERRRIEDESNGIDRFMSMREETDAENAYQDWASDQRDNGEDDSREVFADHIDSLIPDYA